MINRGAQFFKRLSPWRVLVLAVIFLLLLAYLDYVSGPDIRLGVFYVVPLVLVAFFVGPRAGMIMAVVAAGTWLSTDLWGEKNYHNITNAYISGTVRFAFFLLTTYVLNEWKVIGRRLEKQVEERTAELSQCN